MLVDSRHLGWLTLGLTAYQRGWTEGIVLSWDFTARLMTPTIYEGEVVASRGHTSFRGDFRLVEAADGPMQTWHVNDDSLGEYGFPNEWRDEVPYGTTRRYRLAFDGMLSLYDVDVLTPEGKIVNLPKVSVTGDLLVDDQVTFLMPDNHAGWFNEGRRDLFIPHQRPHPKDLELGVYNYS